MFRLPILLISFSLLIQFNYAQTTIADESSSKETMHNHSISKEPIEPHTAISKMETTSNEMVKPTNASVVTTKETSLTVDKLTSAKPMKSAEENPDEKPEADWETQNDEPAADHSVKDTTKHEDEAKPTRPPTTHGAPSTFPPLLHKTEPVPTPLVTEAKPVVSTVIVPTAMNPKMNATTMKSITTPSQNSSNNNFASIFLMVVCLLPFIKYQSF